MPLFKKVDISKRKEERTRFEEILTIISQSKSLILKSIADMHKQIDHCTHEIWSYFREQDKIVNRMLKLLIETDKKLAISVNKNVIPNREFMSLKFKDFLNKISSLSIKTVSELKTFTETAWSFLPEPISFISVSVTLYYATVCLCLCFIPTTLCTLERDLGSQRSQKCQK